MEGGLKLDSWGYEVKTSSDDCISAINSYYEQVLGYGRERRVILRAVEFDKDCVLANILAAHFLHSSDPGRVNFHVQAAKRHLGGATLYERAVFDAVYSLIKENRDEDVALEMHSKLLDDFPKDLVSLKWAQILCFYMGNPELSLSLVQKVLPQNQHANYVYGMLAFPLLEVGRMEGAEEAARKGYEINNNDYWAQHAVCHVLQYECRFEEAVRFMEKCSPSWNSCSSFMLTHNWWHVALCYLEAHSPIQRVLDVYDHHIWKELERPHATPPEVYLNALGLMLRLYVRDKMDLIKDRLEVLASSVMDPVNWYLEWHLDILILWALAETGKSSKAEELLKGLEYRFSKMSKKKQQLMESGITLAKAMYEYGKGNDRGALELLGPNFDAISCKVIGASDEQLDVFNEVWYVMLLNSGQDNKAKEVLEEQIKKREGAPFLWRLLERSYAMSSKPEAKFAGEKANALEAACLF